MGLRGDSTCQPDAVNGTPLCLDPWASRRFFAQMHLPSAQLPVIHHHSPWLVISRVSVILHAALLSSPGHFARSLQSLERLQPNCSVWPCPAPPPSETPLLEGPILDSCLPSPPPRLLVPIGNYSPMVGDGHLLLPEDFSLLGCWSRVQRWSRSG